MMRPSALNTMPMMHSTQNTPIFDGSFAPRTPNTPTTTLKAPATIRTTPPMVPNTATPAPEELAWDMANPLAPTVSTIPETAIIAPTTMPMIDRTFNAVCELVFIRPSLLSPTYCYT